MAFIKGLSRFGKKSNMQHPSIVYHCLCCTQGLLIESHPIKRVLMPHNKQTCCSSILFLQFVCLFFLSKWEHPISDLMPLGLSGFTLWLGGYRTGRHQQHNHLTFSGKCWVGVVTVKVRLSGSGRDGDSSHSGTPKTPQAIDNCGQIRFRPVAG